MGSILGGGGSKSSSSSTSGYAALPPQLRAVFDQIGQAIGQYSNPNNPGVTGMFTPMQQTEDENAAIERMRQGFAPTAQSIGSDIAMQQNPYDQYVIDEINRQSRGQNSVLQQNLNKSGQLGSNRGMLGANDIDLSRMNLIGNFKQGQFNTALNNAMTVLPQARANDAQGLMNIGNFQRGLDWQTRQAPISALGAATGMMSPFVQGGTTNSTTSNGGSGMLGGFGNLLSGGSALGKAYSAGQLFGYSDARLKENIKPIGQENGYNIYEFNYRGYPDRRYVGVMAQEVALINPYAVIETLHGLAVDYDKIGVKFREAV